MNSQISKALAKGFKPYQILEFILKKFPHHASKINAALAAGFTADQVLKYISGGKKALARDDNLSDGPKTEHGKTLRKDIRQRENINKAAMALGGLAASSLAPGLAGASNIPAALQGQALQRAVPANLLPLLESSTNQSPQGRIPYTPTPQPPTDESIENNIPQEVEKPPVIPAETQPEITPKESFSPELVPEEIRDLQKSESERENLWKLLNSGKRFAAKDEFLKYARKLVKSGDIQNFQTFKNFHKHWKATEGQKRGNPLVEFEKFRVMTRGFFDPPEEGEKSVSGIMDFSKESKTIEQEKKPEAIEPEVIEEPEKVEKGVTVASPSGNIGKVEAVRNGIVLVNENGKKVKYHIDDLDIEPPEVIELVHSLLKIPESDRSSIIAAWGYDPARKDLFVQYHDGSLYSYDNVEENDLKELSESKGIPKTTGKSEYGEHVAGVADSRGAALIEKIIRNPKYSKDNRGKTYRRIDLAYDYWKKLRKQPKRKKKQSEVN